MNEINKELLKASAANGVTFEDLQEIGRRLGKVFNSVDFQRAAENMKKASEAMVQFNKELEKVVIKEKQSVNPLTRLYKRKRR